MRLYIYHCPVCDLWQPCKLHLDRYEQQTQGYCKECKANNFFPLVIQQLELETIIQKIIHDGTNAPLWMKPKLREEYKLYQPQLQAVQQRRAHYGG